MEDNEFILTIFSYIALWLLQIYRYFSIPTSFFYKKATSATNKRHLLHRIREMRIILLHSVRKRISQMSFGVLDFFLTETLRISDTYRSLRPQRAGNITLGGRIIRLHECGRKYGTETQFQMSIPLERLP